MNYLQDITTLTVQQIISLFPKDVCFIFTAITVRNKHGRHDSEGTTIVKYKDYVAVFIGVLNPAYSVKLNDELANTMKYGGGLITLFSPSDVTAIYRMGEGVLYNLVFTEWRHCVPQNRGLVVILWII